MAHHKRRGDSQFWKNVELQEKLEEYERQGVDVTELIATQAEFGFEMAVVLLKEGHKLARKGWNGAGMFVYLVPAASYPATTEHARKHFGHMVPYRQYLALKTAQNDVATWSPSGSDALAEDWIVIE